MRIIYRVIKKMQTKSKARRAYIVCMILQWTIKTKNCLHFPLGRIACSVEQLHRFIVCLYSVQVRQKHDEINPAESFVCERVFMYFVVFVSFHFILRVDLSIQRVQQQQIQNL